MKFKSVIFVAGWLFMVSTGASAGCTHPGISKSIARFEQMLKNAPAKAGAKANEAPPLSVDLVFDYAPMSEDLGPEVIGPTTLVERVIPDYLRDMDAKGKVFTSGVLHRNIQILSALCQKVEAEQTKSKRVVDIIPILKKLTGST